MRFLADENFPLPGVSRLRAAGIDIASVSEGTPGVADSDVLARGVCEGRVLLTFDIRNPTPQPPPRQRGGGEFIGADAISSMCRLLSISAACARGAG